MDKVHKILSVADNLEYLAGKEVYSRHGNKSYMGRIIGETSDPYGQVDFWVLLGGDRILKLASENYCIEYDREF
jgi:hypothetical protein